MKVLFITEKWCDGKPEMGLTNSYHNLFGTLRASSLVAPANISVVHFDECLLTHQTHFDEFAKQVLDEIKPDVTVITNLGTANCNPTEKTHQIVKSSNSKLCFIWPYSGYGWVSEAINKIGDYADLHVTFDVLPCKHSRPEKHLSLWAPQDPSLYNDLQTKDISLSFMGSITGYNDRFRYLKFLLEKKREIFIQGGQRENKLTPEQYAEAMRRSKSTLNFSESAQPGLRVCKGRVFEALACGCLLVEESNDAIKTILKAGEHFVEFDSEDQLLHLLDWSSSDSDSALKIAKAGKNVYEDNFTPKHFWSRVFERLM